ncbi:hypothetical protein [Spirosoma arboris]
MKSDREAERKIRRGFQWNPPPLNQNFSGLINTYSMYAKTSSETINRNVSMIKERMSEWRKSEMESMSGSGILLHTFTHSLFHL